MAQSYLARTTPGVYVTEFDAFPPSITGVATAVPLFIGYTEFAGDPVTGQPLYGVPVQISSMRDYTARFGGAAAGGDFNLAVQVALFYGNGGGNCFIVSAGSYWAGQQPAAAPSPDGWALDQVASGPLLAGLDAAGGQVGPTLLVVPEACLLDQAGYAAVVQAMIAQASRMQDRMAILDLPGCTTAKDIAALTTCQQNLWVALGPQSASLSYAAAYGPALVLPDGTVMPPSGAIAGVYAQIDANRGVWNAPANVTLAGVADVLYRMSDAEQGDFNVPLNGMAVDILRAFVNRGVVVWGARTLDGNSLDYRYVQVRRTLLYIEQSIQGALRPYAFQPNTGQTWVSATAMISNFLTGIWVQGGLMGDKASDAFTVQCGLGATMTAQDILAGNMIMNVTLQMIRPAEFIELSFTQKMSG